MQEQIQDNVIDLLKMRRDEKTASERAFNELNIPPWYYYIRPEEVDRLRYIATSIKYAGNAQLKLKAIREVMERNGFRKLGGGTNRVAYRHLEDTRFVAKVAIDRVGMGDNPAEFQNQAVLKPFCAKMFSVTPCGTVGFSERVLPIRNRMEFQSIASDVFDLLMQLIGDYVLEDVGNEYFLNWGITNRGPVLLDYPYVYELDPVKLFCNKIGPDGRVCGGFIDYDNGLNHLSCTRCGKRYKAIDFKKYRERNEVLKPKGGTIPMKVVMKKNGKIIATNDSADIIKSVNGNANPFTCKQENLLTVKLKKGDKVIASSEMVVREKKEELAEAPDLPAIKAKLKKGDTVVAANTDDEEINTFNKDDAPADIKQEPIPKVEPVEDESLNNDIPVDLVDMVKDRISDLSESFKSKSFEQTPDKIIYVLATDDGMEKKIVIDLNDLIKAYTAKDGVLSNEDIDIESIVDVTPSSEAHDMDDYGASEEEQHQAPYYAPVAAVEEENEEEEEENSAPQITSSGKVSSNNISIHSKFMSPDNEE